LAKKGNQNVQNAEQGLPSEKKENDNNDGMSDVY
jgi:hypothetical protein